MGMYDNVVCKKPLPDGYQGNSMQTKCFSCELDTYEISVSGRLLRSSWSKDSTEDVNYHGWFRFYDSDKVTGNWHEYKAKFTDGNLVEIVQVSPAPATQPENSPGK